jgi:hypothetical protein
MGMATPGAFSPGGGPGGDASSSFATGAPVASTASCDHCSGPKVDAAWLDAFGVALCWQCRKQDSLISKSKAKVRWPWPSGARVLDAAAVHAWHGCTTEQAVQGRRACVPCNFLLPHWRALLHAPTAVNLPIERWRPRVGEMTAAASLDCSALHASMTPGACSLHWHHPQ